MAVGALAGSRDSAGNELRLVDAEGKLKAGKNEAMLNAGGDQSHGILETRGTRFRFKGSTTNQNSRSPGKTIPPIHEDAVHLEEIDRSNRAIQTCL